jgi:transporter family protein
MFLSGSLVELKSIPAKALVLLIIEAAMATILGDLAYFAALKRGSASIVMIIMACSPLVTILFSVFFLHEALTYKVLFGAFLTFVGLILVM